MLHVRQGKMTAKLRIEIIAMLADLLTELRVQEQHERRLYTPAGE